MDRRQSESQERQEDGNNSQNSNGNRNWQNAPRTNNNN